MTDKQTKNSNKKDNEDNALWDYITKDIVPLHDDPSKETVPLQSELKTGARSKSQPTPPQVTDTTPQRSQKSDDHSPRQTDRRTSQRLKRGQINIDARVDLHGLNQNQAYDALMRVIPDAYNQGKRCILVITGKGGNRLDPLDNAMGILKQKTPEWLSQQPLSQYVLKTEPAKPKDGGNGALYVLLKRQR